MCSVLTTVHLPSNIDFESLQRELRKKSIIIYEGKGPFKGKMFQVGSIGELTHRDVQFFLRTLRDSLQNHIAAKLTRHPIIVNGIPEFSDIAIAPSFVDLIPEVSVIEKAPSLVVAEVVAIDNGLNRPSL
jgi:hypothetical protein